MNIQLIPIWVKLLVVLALAGGLVFTGYNLGYDSRDLEVKTEQLAAIEDAAVREDSLRAQLSIVSMNLQEALQQVRVEVVYVDRVTRQEIQKPIYNQCLVPQSGTQLMVENATRLNNLRGK